MNENVVEFIKINLENMAAVGSGIGFLLAGTGALLGYMISKVQGLFEK